MDDWIVRVSWHKHEDGSDYVMATLCWARSGPSYDGSGSTPEAALTELILQIAHEKLD